MKGQILDFTIQTNSGTISGDDGKRYSFKGTEWKENVTPSRGLYVDFEIEEQEAIGIYTALSNPQPNQSSNLPSGKKSKAAATLWGVFLGGFGAHKFYLGSWGWGIVYLLTCWLYIPFIVAMVEWIHYVLLTDEEFRLKAEEFKDKGPFGFFW